MGDEDFMVPLSAPRKVTNLNINGHKGREEVWNVNWINLLFRASLGASVSAGVTRRQWRCFGLFGGGAHVIHLYAVSVLSSI